MDCLVSPVSIWKKRSLSRRGYRELSSSDEESSSAVTVVVGKEEREFRVEPFVLEESPFRALLEMVRKEKEKEKEELQQQQQHQKKKKSSSAPSSPSPPVIYVDVDAILFEHMLWLMHNDCSSFSQLNLREIIDFYAQDN